MTDLARATMAAAVVEAVGIAGPRSDALLSIRLLKSPAYRCMTRSAHLALAKIVIERASGRFAITHAQFAAFGVDRCGIAHAVAELEALGVVAVHRAAAKANEFCMSDKWCSIRTVAQAKALRDKARHFGIIRRRKVARRSGQRLTHDQSAAP